MQLVASVLILLALAACSSDPRDNTGARPNTNCGAGIYNPKTDLCEPAR